MLGQLGPDWHFYSIKSGPENGPKLGQLGPAWPFYAAIFRHIYQPAVWPDSGHSFFFELFLQFLGKIGLIMSYIVTV